MNTTIRPIFSLTINGRTILGAGFFNGEFNFVILFSDGADPFLVERNRADFVGSHAISIWKASQKSDELEVSELLEKFFPEQKVHAVSSDDTSIGLLVR